MSRLRRLLFWCHLAAGLSAGALILVLSVTGLLLAYERQVVSWAERDQRRLTPAPGAVRRPVGELLARVREARPEASPTGITLQADPSAAAAVALGRDGTLYLNPCTGAVLGNGSKAARGFFPLVAADLVVAGPARHHLVQARALGQGPRPQLAQHRRLLVAGPALARGAERGLHVVSVDDRQPSAAAGWALAWRRWRAYLARAVRMPSESRDSNARTPITPPRCSSRASITTCCVAGRTSEPNSGRP